MNINPKPITPSPSVISSNAKRMPSPSTSYAVNLPFKSGNNMKKSTFNNLMEKVFLRLENVNDDYFVEGKWMYAVFKEHLKNSKTPLYNKVHSIMQIFYKDHPFDTINHLSKIMSAFFNKWKIGNVDKNPEWSIILNTQDGFKKVANLIFIQLFQTTLEEETIAKIEITYAKFTDIFRQLLKSKVENIMKGLNSEFLWSNFSLLEKWIENFDYESLRSIKGQSIYDQYFSEPQRIDLSERDYKKILNTFFDDNLDPSAKKLMQMVLYYIFEDLTLNNKFQDLKVVSAAYKDAQKLVDDIENNSNPLKSLQVLLPGISNLIKKYKLNWKSLDSESGFVIHQAIGYKLLDLDDNSNTTYKLTFVFRFITDSVAESTTRNKYSSKHIIQIHPVKKIIPLFDIARNKVTVFKNIVEWNAGYKSNSSERWTEKDMVHWISSFTSYTNILTTSESEINEIDITSDWENFSPTSFFSLDSISNSKFEFKARPIIKFIKGSNKTFGDVEVYVRLTQIDVKSSTIIKTEDIKIKSRSQILSIIDVIKNSMSSIFPNGLNFDLWEKNNHFWLNEFLMQNEDITRWLREESEMRNRTNYIPMHDELNELTDEVHRDYFSKFPNPSFFEWTYKNDITKNGELISWTIRLNFGIIDNRFSHETILYEATKQIEYMRVFDEIKIGPFKGKYGEELIYLKTLKLMILLDGTQPVPLVGETLPLNFKFKNSNNSEIVLLDDIKNQLIKFDFKNIVFSLVKKLSPQEAGITITYDVDYYDFNEGKYKTANLSYDLAIEFDNVPPKVIQETYDNIINSLNPVQKLSKKLLQLIDDNFSSLKVSGTNNWRTDVGEQEYNDVIKRVRDLIKDFVVNEDVIKELSDLYGGDIPQDILDKLQNPEYVDVIKEILKWKSDFPKEKIKQILENDKFMETLKKIKFDQIKNIIRNFLKITNNTKYVYLASGIGLGVSGVIAGLSSLRWLRLNSKTKKVSTSFKKSKYISTFSALVSLIAIGGSVALTLIFFLLKGGF